MEAFTQHEVVSNVIDQPPKEVLQVSQDIVVLIVENNCFYSVSGIYLSDGKINCKQAQGRQFSYTV